MYQNIKDRGTAWGNFAGKVIILSMIALILLIYPVGNAAAQVTKDAQSSPALLNVGPWASSDSAQMGYDSTFSGSGTIGGVTAGLDAIPSATDSNGFVALLLDTGDLTGSGCSGFMQVGVWYTSSAGGWAPVYTNNNCAATNMGGITVAATDSLGLTILNEVSSSQTWFKVTDNNGGRSVTVQVSNTGDDWSANTFQTMAEATCDGCSAGSTSFIDSQFIESTGTQVYITASSSTNSDPSDYGGVCSTSSYSLGSWQNSATYGYSQASLSTRGYCANAILSTSHNTGCSIGTCGQVNSPDNLLGGPDGSYANLRAPNSGDWAYIQADWGTGTSIGSSYEFSGTLSIDAYSYNNGGGAYYSTVTVYTSSDGSTWTNVYSSTWNPSGTNSPTWITIGTVSGIRYVEIYVSDASGLSGDIFIDAMSIG